MNWNNTEIILLPSKEFYNLDFVQQVKVVRTAFDNIGICTARDITLQLLEGERVFKVWARGRLVSFNEHGLAASIPKSTFDLRICM